MIKYKTLGCPSVEVLKGSKVVDMEDSLKLEMFSIANSCVILSKEDSVEALGYDPRNSKDIFQEILYKKISTVLYILREAIHVEYGGKKNTYRF
ncbi:MAG: hypothetical protein DSZ04_02700 [Sulfurimonas sp.]|nr:MAG: hypothetical protein DSZ04_02700 [Sulfurimonas sp.]